MLLRLLRVDNERFLWNKLSLCILSIYLIITALFLASGVRQLNLLISEKNKFEKFENEKYKQFVFASQYADYGFRLLFNPSPGMVLFSGTVPPLLTAFIDTSERLIIYTPENGRNALTSFRSSYTTYAGFTLVFGSLLAGIFGLCTFRDREWFLYLEGITRNSRKKLFLMVSLSRIITIFFLCSIMAIISFFILAVNGIHLPVNDFLTFFFTLFISFLLFLFIGFTFGQMKNVLTGTSIFAVIWFLLILVIPSLISHNTYIFNNVQSSYDIEGVKQKYLMDFERKVIKTAGKFSDSKRGTEQTKLLANEYLNDGFRKIMELEEENLKQIKRSFKQHSALSIIFPTTFLESVNEISSTGMKNFAGFYEYSIQTKRNFLKYYTEKYICAVNNKIEPFIRSSENVFQGKSYLPDYFFVGLGITLFWCFFFFCLAFYRFTRLEYKNTLKNNESRAALSPENPKFKVESATLVYSVTENLSYRNHKESFDFFLSELRKRKKNFLFLPVSSAIPEDIKVKDIYKTAGIIPTGEIKDKKFAEIGKDDKSSVLIDIARQVETEYLILNDFHKGCSIGFLNNALSEFIKEMKLKRVIINFTEEPCIYTEAFDNMQPIKDEQ